MKYNYIMINHFPKSKIKKEKKIEIGINIKIGSSYNNYYDYFIRNSKFE